MKNILGLFCFLILFQSCGEEIDCCVNLPETNFTFDVAAKGCSNFYIYKELPEENLHLFVQGDRAALGLDLTEQEFEVTNEAITVAIHQFDGEIGQYACDDVANDQGEIVTTWNAITGKVYIQIVEDDISVNDWERTYKIKVKLNNIQVQDEIGNLASLTDTEFKEVYVGWLPG